MEQERRRAETKRAWARARAAQQTRNQNAESRHHAAERHDNVRSPRARNTHPQTIDLTACDTAGAVTVEDIKRAEQEKIRKIIEARISKSKTTQPERQVQSKVTSYFQQSKIKELMNRNQRQLDEARRAIREDEELNNQMHLNIATANNREEREYSRLVSAELLEDERRRRTSEDGESSSPKVSWTPESSSSNQAVAWPGERERQTIADKYPSATLDPNLGMVNISTDPSRSPTPQPKIKKPKHKVLAVRTQVRRKYNSMKPKGATEGPDTKPRDHQSSGATRTEEREAKASERSSSSPIPNTNEPSQPAATANVQSTR